MNRPTHFEIQATDPARAMKFYTDVFGWSFSQWKDWHYWAVITGPKDEPGINGGLLLRKGAEPVEAAAVNAYVCTIVVENFDTTAEKIITGGGSVAVAKQDLDGVAYLGYFKDTEGNIFGLMEEYKKI